jgi:hypothetical protein
MTHSLPLLLILECTDSFCISQSMEALDAELNDAAQLYRPLLCSLSFVVPHLPADCALRLLSPLLHLAQTARSVEQQTSPMSAPTFDRPGSSTLNAALGNVLNTTAAPPFTRPVSLGTAERKGGAAADSEWMRPALVSSTALSLCTQCCGRLLKSDPKTPLETQLQKWLDSPLLAGGLLYAQTRTATPKQLAGVLAWLRENKIQVFSGPLALYVRVCE